MRPQFRAATIDDVSFIVSLVMEFSQKVAPVYGIETDAPTVRMTITRLVKTGIVIVGKSSVAAATLIPYPWNANALIGQVWFWYFRSPREIVIIKSLLWACKKAGATHFAAASHYPKNTVARYYARLGLKPVERQSMTAL